MPIGPYETFGECVGAQKRKGKSDESARNICGAMERDAAKVASLEKLPERGNNHFLVRAFLLDPSLNINKWAVTEESIDRNINSFIGKPLVLTENYDHPGGEIESLSHWLAYQETFRVGTITEIVTRKNPGTGSTAYHAIIEITDEDVKADIRNNNMPLYVSPAIAEPIDSHMADAQGQQISHWQGIHLAIVDQPAFGIKKAVISDICEGGKRGCLLQLRKAHIMTHGLTNCGFCRKGALTKYHQLVASYQLSTSHSRNSSANSQYTMSQLEPMDSTAPNDATKPIEKVEEPFTPPQTKQAVNPPPSNTPTNIRDLLNENQKLLHELELRDLKINELTEAHSTVQERIAALELRDRRKDIERIITPDVIKDDKQRLEKIKYFVGTTIPINEIESLYQDLKVTIKKANVQGKGGARVPYGVTSNLSATSTNTSSNNMIDEDTGLTPLQKQLAVLRGGI